LDFDEFYLHDAGMKLATKGQEVHDEDAQDTAIYRWNQVQPLIHKALHQNPCGLSVVVAFLGKPCVIILIHQCHSL
jgi:hypothetical protein